MAKLKVQSEDQVVWADGTEGPGARPSGLCCMWPWEERKHRRDQAVPHGKGAEQQSLSTATPSESTRTRIHPVSLLVPCVTTHKAMPRWTNFSPSAHTIHKHTYTCACCTFFLYLTQTQHSLRLQRDSSHHLPTSGKINPSASTWHYLPL